MLLSREERRGNERRRQREEEEEEEERKRVSQQPKGQEQQLSPGSQGQGLMSLVLVGTNRQRPNSNHRMLSTQGVKEV